SIARGAELLAIGAAKALMIAGLTGYELQFQHEKGSVLDSEGLPAVTIELVDVRVVPMKEIDDDFARAEGRGYSDVAQWRTAHEEFFRSDGVSEFLGRTPVIDDDTLVVAERFRVVEPDDPDGA
ncbi:ASCH domain-containing protein, partial [Streptosporangium pseudovulgare]|uniref:ASCH domain-containing protein n=1 Tax=Streptosporangium pseudovulgare TaxID=35765 RepID=UPI00167087E9